MKWKRFTEEEIVGILKESDQEEIHPLETHGDPQAVGQRIASIVRGMHPHLIVDARETITAARITVVVAPAWAIVDGLTALRFGARPGCSRVVFLELLKDVPCRSGSAQHHGKADDFG